MRVLLSLSWSGQSSAGRRFTSHAHGSCLLLPDVAHFWHHPPTRLSTLFGDMKLSLITPFSVHPYRLLIHPSNIFTEQMIALQGKTSGITNTCQLRGTAVHTCPDDSTEHLNHILMRAECQDYCRVCYCEIDAWFQLWLAVKILQDGHEWSQKIIQFAMN